MKKIFLKSMISVFGLFLAVNSCGAVSKNIPFSQNVKKNAKNLKVEIRYETDKSRKIEKLRSDLYKFIKKSNETKEIDKLNDEIKNNINILKKSKESKTKQEITDLTNLILAQRKNLHNLKETLNKKLEKLKLQYKKVLDDIKQNKEKEEDVDLNINNITIDDNKNANDTKFLFYGLDDVNMIDDELSDSDNDKIINDKSDKEKFDEMKKKIINKYRYAEIPAVHDQACFDFTNNFMVGDEDREKENKILSEGLYKEILAFCMILEDIASRNQIKFYCDENSKEPIKEIFDLFKDIFTKKSNNKNEQHKWFKNSFEKIEKKLVLYMKNKDKYKLRRALREELKYYIPKEKKFLEIKNRVINLIRKKIEKNDEFLSEFLLSEFCSSDYNLNKYLRKLLNRIKKIKKIKFEDVENVIKNLRAEKYFK